MISLGAHERNRETLGSEPTCTSNTMEVGISVAREIIVDSQVDTLDVDATTKNVSGNADTLVELLELLIALDTI